MITTTFIRYDRAAFYASRVFGPREADDVHECLACVRPFRQGDYTVLVPLGPGPSEEDQDKCRASRWYNSVCIEIHYACATGHKYNPLEVVSNE